MKLNTKNIRKNINITPGELVKKVNNKGLRNLGYKIIHSITTTVNHKIRVSFLNEKVLNFHNFTYALEYLNATYNLKLFENKSENNTTTETIEKNISNISIATKVSSLS